MSVASLEKYPSVGGPEVTSASQIHEARLNEDVSALLDGWNACNANWFDHTIFCDPDWMQQQYKNKLEAVHVYWFGRKAAISGVVPFVMLRQPLLCQLGDFVAAKFPLRVFRMLGYTPNLPAEASAYDMLFEQMLTSDFDAIFMNYVKADSFLWKYLHDSPIIKRSFRFYSRRGPEPHLLIRMSGTFDDYMQKFSAKSRNTRLRKIKKLGGRGDIELIRVTRADDVDKYLDAAAEISRKTWQFKRFGWGVGGWDLELQKACSKFAAQRGWLRSYLLLCGGVPCAYIHGQQYRGRYYHAVLGFDPAWSQYSVGTVLQFLVIEDLYKENKPELYDFGTYAEYKQYFANESYPEAVVWLFRRRPYPLLADSIHRIFCATSTKAKRILDRVGLKERVKQTLRGQT